MKKACTTIAVGLAAVLAAAPGQSQQSPGLPTGEMVLKDYIEATGGKAAYEKLTNRVGVGTIEVTGANLKGKMTLTQAAPGKLLNQTDLGAAGKTVQGTDGQVAWEISTFNGERVLQGEEDQVFQAQAVFNGELHWNERYQKVECVGIENVDGKPAYKVVLTRALGKPVIEFYDVQTHLMTKQTSTTVTPMGEVKIDVYPEDYRRIDGVLMPMVARQKIFGQEMVLSFTEVKHNVDLPKDTFVPPQSILELAKKKAK